MAEPLFTGSSTDISWGAAMVLCYSTLMLGYLIGWVACELNNDK